MTRDGGAKIPVDSRKAGNFTAYIGLFRAEILIFLITTGIVAVFAVIRRIISIFYSAMYGVFGQKQVRIPFATYYPGSCQKFSRSSLLLIT